MTIFLSVPTLSSLLCDDQLLLTVTVVNCDNVPNLKVFDDGDGWVHPVCADVASAVAAHNNPLLLVFKSKDSPHFASTLAAADAASPYQVYCALESDYSAASASETTTARPVGLIDAAGAGSPAPLCAQYEAILDARTPHERATFGALPASYAAEYDRVFSLKHLANEEAWSTAFGARHPHACKTLIYCRTQRRALFLRSLLADAAASSAVRFPHAEVIKGGVVSMAKLGEVWGMDSYDAYDPAEDETPPRHPQPWHK